MSDKVSKIGKLEKIWTLTKTACAGMLVACEWVVFSLFACAVAVLAIAVWPVTLSVAVVFFTVKYAVAGGVRLARRDD